MGLMWCQDTYFPVSVKEERTTIALSAYTFSRTAEWSGWCPGLQERSACSRKIKKALTCSEVDNVKCVAYAHVTFCESQINQGSWSSKKALAIENTAFPPPCPSLGRRRLWLELAVIRHRYNGVYRKAIFM